MSPRNSSTPHSAAVLTPMSRAGTRTFAPLFSPPTVSIVVFPASQYFLKKFPICTFCIGRFTLIAVLESHPH
jgi:hypothetical protein